MSAGPLTPMPAAGRPSQVVTALYPIVPLLAFVIALWGEAEVDVSDLVRPALAAIVVGLAIIAVTRLAARDGDLAGIAAIAVAVAILVMDPVRSAMMLGLALVVILVGRLTDRQRPRLHAVARFGAIVAWILLGVTVIRAGLPAVTLDALTDRVGSPPSAAGEVTRPDIYMLMLDGYPGTEAAAEAPWFDRERFPAALRARGLDVVDGSRSNYTWTILTLASMFGNRHLTPADDRLPFLRSLVRDSPVIEELHRDGYETTAFASGFAAADLHGVHHLVKPPQLSDVEVALLRSTILGTVMETLAPGLIDELQRRRIEATLDEFAELASIPSDPPRFVFAHVPAPHAPWVYGPNGEPVRDGLQGFYTDSPDHRGIDPDDARRRIYDQVDHVSDLVLATLDRVIATVPDDAILVVFSDHGPRMHIDPPDPTEGIETRSSNLIAIRAPGRSPMPAGSTPINILPWLLADQPGSELQLLADATYVWTRGDVRGPLVPVPPTALD